MIIIIIVATKNKKIVFAIIAAVVVVASSFTYFELNSLNTQGKEIQKIPLVLGPQIALNIYNGSRLDPSLGNNTTVTVQISSVMPSMFIEHSSGSDLMGLNPDNNSYDVTLLNTTLNNTTSVLFISPLFMDIADMWKSLFSYAGKENIPSLSIESYKTVYSNGILEVFKYYNNIPYDPYRSSLIVLNESQLSNHTIMNHFNGTGLNVSRFSSITMSDISFRFNITFPVVPMQIIDNVSSNRTSNAVSPVYRSVKTACPGTSSKTSYGWETTYFTWNKKTFTKSIYDGYIPLLAVHVGNGVSQGQSVIALAASIFVLNDTIGLNSAETYVSSSGEVT